MVVRCAGFEILRNEPKKHKKMKKQASIILFTIALAVNGLTSCGEGGEIEGNEGMEQEMDMQGNNEGMNQNMDMQGDNDGMNQDMEMQEENEGME